MGQIMHTGWITSGPGQGLTPYPIFRYLHGYSLIWGSGKEIFHNQQIHCGEVPLVSWIGFFSLGGCWPL